MFHFKGRSVKGKEKLSGLIKQRLRKHKIGIREEISEDLLKEVFLEVKERIKQRTKYEVNKIDFPKDHLFAWLLR